MTLPDNFLNEASKWANDFLDSAFQSGYLATDDNNNYPLITEEYLIEWFTKAIKGAKRLREDLFISAKQLDDKLRQYPWYSSIGIGQYSGLPTLFVYTLSNKHNELKALENGWQGHKIIIKSLGKS